MAAFNASAHISRAINSVINQTYLNWELICVDDGSIDDTLKIITRFSESDDRIRVIRQENSGPALARRAAYLIAKGEWLVSLDSDDWFAEDTVSNLVDDAISTGADMVMADMLRMNVSSQAWVSFSNERGLQYGAKLSGEEAFSLTFPWVVNGQFLAKRDIIISSAGLDNYFNNYNSDEYLTRVYCLKADMIYFSRGAYHYFANPTSLTSGATTRRLAFIQTNQRLLRLAIDSNVSSENLEKVLKQVEAGLFRYSSLLGYHFGNGTLSRKHLWNCFVALKKSEKLFSIEEQMFHASNGRNLQVWGKTRNIKYFFWFLRGFAAQKPMIVKIKRLLKP